MVISRHTLKRASTHKKSTMTCGISGTLNFTKSAAVILNAPCKLSFDFDQMICFHDTEDGFELRCHFNGFMIFSKILCRFIEDKFAVKRMKFEISPTLDKNIFRLQWIEPKQNQNETTIRTTTT